jgi:hypothetical protein
LRNAFFRLGKRCEKRSTPTPDGETNADGNGANDERDGERNETNDGENNGAPSEENAETIDEEIAAPVNNETDEGKISAEWQGKNGLCDVDLANANAGQYDPQYNPAQYNPAWKGEMDARTPAYYEAQRRAQTEEVQKTRSLGRRKKLFVLAFIGLLLDFACGLGFFMCLPVAIVATVDAKRLYAAEKKTSTQLIWTMVIGYLGALLGIKELLC